MAIVDDLLLLDWLVVVRLLNYMTPCIVVVMIITLLLMAVNDNLLLLLLFLYVAHSIHDAPVHAYRLSGQLLFLPLLLLFVPKVQDLVGVLKVVDRYDAFQVDVLRHHSDVVVAVLNVVILKDEGQIADVALEQLRDDNNSAIEEECATPKVNIQRISHIMNKEPTCFRSLVCTRPAVATLAIALASRSECESVGHPAADGPDGIVGQSPPGAAVAESRDVAALPRQ